MTTTLPYQLVRLAPEIVDTIVDAFKANFSATDHLWIFGSRVDLNARGGDIDLYVETESTNAKVAIENRIKFLNEILNKIGEQQIDVVLNLKNDKIDLPIYREALINGVKLV